MTGDIPIPDDFDEKVIYAPGKQGPGVLPEELVELQFECRESVECHEHCLCCAETICSCPNHDKSSVNGYIAHDPEGYDVWLCPECFVWLCELTLIEFSK